MTGIELKRSEFALVQVVMGKDKNLSAKFIIAKNNNGEIFEADGTLNYKHQSTESFQAKLSELQPYLCSIKKVIDNEDVKSKIHVKGLKLSGSGDNEGFEILGSQNSDGDGIMKCDSHKIHYEGEEYSWLEEVRDIAEEIENKTFSYLFEGDKAQPSLFEDAQEVDENEDEKLDFDEAEEVTEEQEVSEEENTETEE